MRCKKTIDLISFHFVLDVRTALVTASNVQNLNDDVVVVMNILEFVAYRRRTE